MNQTVAAGGRVEPHYRIAVAAGMVGLSRATIFRLIRDGRIGVKRIGPRVTLIPESELRKLLDGQS